MQPLRYILLGLFILSLPAHAEKEIKGAISNQPPLFPIELNEKFPKPEKTFKEVKKRLLKHYYSNELNEDALYYAAIQGMLRHVSPPNNKDLAQLWSPKQYEAFSQILQGVQTAIGAKLQPNLKDGSLTVTHISPHSPADGKLNPYDRIMRINGQPLKGKTIAHINQLLSGKEGSVIDLTLVRDISVLTVKLTRRRFNVENIRVKIKESLAYISIANIAENTAQEFQLTLKQLAQEGVKELIIDLRNNGGGDFFQGLRLSEALLPEDSVILRIIQKSQEIQNYVSTNPQTLSFKTIVLINQNTASSAEIFAAALRDHQLARLVGTRSHGKATVEGTYSLNNGYYAKFIIAAMYSPRGQSWHDKGLLPDYFIDDAPNKVNAYQALPLAQQLKNDLQLATAWKLLRDIQ